MGLIEFLKVKIYMNLLDFSKIKINYFKRKLRSSNILRSTKVKFVLLALKKR